MEYKFYTVSESLKEYVYRPEELLARRNILGSLVNIYHYEFTRHTDQLTLGIL